MINYNSTYYLITCLQFLVETARLDDNEDIDQVGIYVLRIWVTVLEYPMTI